MGLLETKRQEDRESLTECLWYRRPAESWQEALPIGNGRLGAMVYGGVNCDKLVINEDSVWGGHETNRNNPKAKQSLEKIRQYIFEEKGMEAETLADQTMIGTPRRVFPYQPLGTLILENRISWDYSGYRRKLDLTDASVQVGYHMKHADYRKEYIASCPDQVLAVRYTCSQKQRFSLIIRTDREENASCRVVSGNILLLEGKADKQGIAFAEAVYVYLRGGSIREFQWRKEISALEIQNVDEVILYVSGETSFRNQDPSQKAISRVLKAAEKGYDSLRKEQIQDYKQLYERFSFQLKTPSVRGLEQLDTVQRLERIQQGETDEKIYELMINYQRYLLIGSSRPGSLPSNLQGIWNHRMLPPWESDFHTNINIQINYWSSEAYHLAECHLPWFEFMKRLEKNGRETAAELYGADGWVMHHCTDIWATTAPAAQVLGIWPMGALWCCRDIYEYYQYTQDKEFLKKNFYMLRGAVAFILDFLTEAPKESPWSGCLATNPSQSPENVYLTEDGRKQRFTWSATMDIELIQDMLDICLDCFEILKEDSAELPEEETRFCEQILETKKRLPPLQISKRTGGIQEWLFDYGEVEPGHRHMSHLYACHPGTMISPEKTPELAKAAKKSIYRRYQNGYDGQGWSLGWLACIWTRLEEPEEAYKALDEIMRKHLLSNLFLEAHGNPQVGDAQSIPAAMLEMLAFSHDGCIRLLPSLPRAFHSGSVRGMKLRGGYELNMEWEKGKLMYAEVTKDGEGEDIPVLIADKQEYEEHMSGRTRIFRRKS